MCFVFNYIQFWVSLFRCARESSMTRTPEHLKCVCVVCVYIVHWTHFSLTIVHSSSHHDSDIALQSPLFSLLIRIYSDRRCSLY